MATRKLKFKPKPSVNVLNIRRAKDTDEAANLLKEKEVHENQHVVSEQPECEKSNTESEVTCVVSDSSDKSTLSVVNSTKPIIESELSENSSAVDTVNLDGNLISTHQSENTSEHVQVIEESVGPASKSVGSHLECSLSQLPVIENNDCVSSIISQVDDSIEKLKTIPNKPGPSVGKGLSRFGRSRYKPILSNPDLRKKGDTGISSEVSQSIVETTEKEPRDNREATASLTNKEYTEEQEEDITTSTIHDLNNQRTESVIKSVQSELSKTQSIVTEIAESFTLLESNEEEIPSLSSSNNARYESGSLTKDQDAENTASLSDIDSSGNSGEAESSRVKPVSSSNKVPVSPVRTTSKILVPKPSPRISEISPRRISFQGSDSEEEVKKRKSYRKKENSKLSNEAKEKNAQTK